MSFETLQKNECFLLITKYGNAFRTTNKSEFDTVSKWGDIIFSGKVKSSHYLFMRLGLKKIVKKLISQIKLSQPFEKNSYFDFSEVTDKIPENQSIKEVWCGSK